ncbi:MAG: PAS domain-containing sensor histidine kinase, partial [Planctomycetota bacterium]
MNASAYRSKEHSVETEFNAELQRLREKTDRAFLFLLVFQWCICMASAAFISPYTWIGAESSFHVHLWMSIFLGGTIVGLPIVLILRQQHSVVTRWVVAASQAGVSALLIHLMGGRIEAHFHIFGILAFLAFYLDKSIYIPTVALVLIDHLARGFFLPQSVFGVSTDRKS